MARSSDSGILLSILKDKTFQAREIRRVVMLTFLYLAITTAMVGIFYHTMLGKLIEGMAPLLFVSEDMALADEALPTLSAVLSNWLLAMLAINAIITVALSIYITRKLGHPILAIKRTLREIGGGNLDVRLRASDSREFGEIASELSAAMQTVRKQVAAAKAGIEKADTGNPDLESFRQAITDCRAALDYFQVDQAANDEDSGNSSDTDKAA